MADIRIKDLATTASSTAADDFLAVDGTTNGTRKLSAATPSFATSVTVPGVAGPTATDLTLAGGSTGASLVLGQGAAAANVTLNATTSGFLSFTKSDDSITPSLARFLNAGATTAGRYNEVIFGKSVVNGGAGTIGYKADTATPANSRLYLVHYGNNQDTGGINLTNTGNLLIGTTTDSGNGKLQLATHTTSAGGIGFGTDTSLYRSASNVLTASGAISTTGDASGVSLYCAGGTAIRNTGIQYIDATTSIIFRTASFATALTLASNQAATFAGAANVNGILKAVAGNSNTTSNIGTYGTFVSFDNNAEKGWIQSIANSGEYRTLQLNPLGGAVTVGGNATFAGAVTVNSVTPSTGAGSGALQVAGGIYAGAASVFGGTVAISGGIVGTTTNNNAAAGIVGEIVTSTVESGSSISLSNSVIGDVTSISLTAGDWDVDGNVAFKTSGATITQFLQGIATASGSPGPTGSYSKNPVGLSSDSNDWFQDAPTWRVSISSTTTIYLIARSLFSAGTVGAYGFLRARRVR